MGLSQTRPHEIHPLIFIKKKTGLRVFAVKALCFFLVYFPFLGSTTMRVQFKITNDHEFAKNVWLNWLNLVNLVKYGELWLYTRKQNTMLAPMFDPSSLPLPGQWSHCRGPTTPEGNEDGQRYLQWPRGGTGLEMWISTIQNGGFGPPKSGTCSNKFGV